MKKKGLSGDKKQFFLVVFWFVHLPNVDTLITKELTLQ